MKNKKITFLSGAGASFGCGKVVPYNPPLGSDLYEDLEIQAPTIMDQINNVIGRKNINNFEKKMNEIWKSGRINGFMLNSFLARYFSRFSPAITNNYFIEMARIIQDNFSADFVYSTLNYDCIAELAASGIGFKVNYMGEFKRETFNVLKLHGSCNFINDSMQGRGNISAGLLRGTVDGGAVSIVQPNQVDTYLQVRPLGPVMAFYMKNKPTQTNKSFLEKIQNSWEKRVLESEKIVIIGVNPNPDDKHVWNPLQKTKAKIGFVGGKKSFAKLKKLQLKKVPKQISNSFEDSTEEIENFL